MVLLQGAVREGLQPVLLQQLQEVGAYQARAAARPLDQACLQPGAAERVWDLRNTLGLRGLFFPSASLGLPRFCYWRLSSLLDSPRCCSLATLIKPCFQRVLGRGDEGDECH